MGLIDAGAIGSTRQIGSTPLSAWWWLSMKAIMAWTGGRAPPLANTGSVAQKFVRSAPFDTSRSSALMPCRSGKQHRTS
jgi:hypothetical protein